MMRSTEGESMTDFCRRVYLDYLQGKTPESTYFATLYREEVRRGLKNPGYSIGQPAAGQKSRWRELFPEKSVEFDRLMEAGFSQRAIARKLSMSRNTIRKVLETEKAMGYRSTVGRVGCIYGEWTNDGKHPPRNGGSGMRVIGTAPSRKYRWVAELKYHGHRYRFRSTNRANADAWLRDMVAKYRWG